MPVVGLLTLELHFPGAQSLKDKRVVLRSIKDRLKRLNVASAEVEHQDLWQRARLAVVTVGAEQIAVQRALDGVIEAIERRDPGIIVGSEVSWLS